MTVARVAQAFRSALLVIAATVLSFLAVFAICQHVGVNASPAVLAAALCIGLMRHPQSVSIRTLLRRLIALPLIALTAGGVGAVLLHAPALGAALFTVCIALSIALRQFGERARALGRTLALPMLTILVVPVAIDDTASKTTMAALIFIAGAIAFLVSALVSHVALHFGSVSEPKAQPPQRVKAPKEGTLPVSFRMALQMFASLTLAFAIGMLAFPAHWPWIVLSAFIVCSGAIGRGDALYKALLRLGGAISGTGLAALLSHLAIPNATLYAALVFLVLFFGIWLRQINYAFWAACATLIFALLQNTHGEAALSLFGARILCIFVGALCGVAATWFVYPIRTEHVVRRRVADALHAMRGILAGEPHDLDYHTAQIARVAPPVRLHRAIFNKRNEEEHPAAWIDRAHALLALMRTPGFDRKQAAEDLRHLGSMLSGAKTLATSRKSSRRRM